MERVELACTTCTSLMIYVLTSVDPMLSPYFGNNVSIKLNKWVIILILRTKLNIILYFKNEKFELKYGMLHSICHAKV